VQPKLTNYTPTSIEDLENHFYDKLNMSVNDVQIILVPSKVNWREYLRNSEQLEYKYHILYPVTTSNTLYLSINPSYKKLPKMKLDAVCTSIGLNFSDNKIIRLFEFSQKFPLPEVPKTSSLATAAVPGTTVGGLSTTGQSSRDSASMRASTIVVGSTADELEKRKAAAAKKKEKDDARQLAKFLPASADTNSNAAQQPPEPDDEWDGPFRLATQINGDPIANYAQLSLNVFVNTFSINLKTTNEALRDEDPAHHTDYLKFFLNHIRIDFAITKYGFSFRAGLGDLKLVDKIHPTDPALDETEILSSLSSTDEEIIKFYFRAVEEEAPNFATLYGKILSHMRFDCSNIRVACHRTVIVYFLNWAKRIVDNVTIEARPPSSTALPAATPALPIHTETKDFASLSMSEFN
jgi:hypothetical protein